MGGCILRGGETRQPTRELWLVTGSTGLLGSAVMRELHLAGLQSVGISRHGGSGSLAFDLDQPACAIQSVLDEIDPDRVLHLAAYSRPADVARRPEAARRLNVEASAAIAAWCAKRDRWLMLASTDQVFSGADGPYKEQDALAPGTLYGATKAEAEEVVLDAGGLVARFGWLLDDTGRPDADFIQRALSRLKAGERVAAADDEYRTPISVTKAAKASLRLAQAARTGVMHVAGASHITPYQLLRRQTRHQPSDAGRIDRISGADLLPAGRPRDVRLSTSRLRYFLAQTTSEPLSIASEVA
jgi:dTDP-4-dehydrorhamnose reductase